MVGFQEIKNAFQVFSGWQGLMILFLSFSVILVGNWKWKEILKGEGVNLSFKELFRPFIAGFSLLYLFPVIIWGGEVFRGYILKEHYAIAWSKGMSSVIIDRVLEWTANLTVIFFGSLLFILKSGFPPQKLGIFLGVLFLIFLSGLSFFYFKCLRKESVAKFFVKSDSNQLVEMEKEIFNFFKIKNNALWKVLSLAFLRAGIMYSRAWILIFFLGKNIGALPALSILGFSYLATMIPIPTALGSHEAIQIFAFGFLGLPASTAAAFAMIIRGTDVIVALIGLIFLFQLGIMALKDVLFKKINHFFNGG